MPNCDSDPPFSISLPSWTRSNKDSYTWEIGFKSLCSTSRHCYVGEQKDKQANEKSSEYKAMVLCMRWKQFDLVSTSFQLGCIKGSQKKRAEDEAPLGTKKAKADPASDLGFTWAFPAIQKPTQTPLDLLQPAANFANNSPRNAAPNSLATTTPEAQRQLVARQSIFATVQSLNQQIHSLINTAAPPSLKLLRVYRVAAPEQCTEATAKFSEVIKSRFGLDFLFEVNASTRTMVGSVNVPDQDTGAYLHQLADLWFSNQPCVLFPQGNSLGNLTSNFELLFKSIL